MSAAQIPTPKPDGNPTQGPPPLPTHDPRPKEERCVVQPLQVECCCCDEPCNCPRLYTRAVKIVLTAQQAAQIDNSIINVMNGWEAAGWLILGSSMITPGTAGGVILVLHIGWYA